MREPDSVACKQYRIFKQAAGKTVNSILVSVGVRLLVHLIERELDEAEKDYERIVTEQAAEENADVDSGEPDGTETEVDAQY